MKPKQFYTTAVALAGMIMAARSQIVSPFILNSTGSSAVIDTIFFEYSVGEMALVETYTTPGLIVTNGLLQPLSGEPQIPLPVTLLSFHGVKMDNYNKLDWKTSFEAGNTIFELQRSNDRIGFTTVYSVPSRNLANGSSYTYNDYTPFGSVVYYRLATRETDGSVKYSGVIVLYNSATGSNWAAYPNPVKAGQLLQVSIHNADDRKSIMVKLMDVKGRLVYQQQRNIEKGSQIMSLPVPAASGTYLLQLTRFTTNQTQKIIVH